MKIKPQILTTADFINNVKVGDLIYWRRKGWRYVFSYIIRFFSQSLASHVVIVKEVLKKNAIETIQTSEGLAICRGFVLLKITHQTFFGIKEDILEFVVHDKKTFIHSYCMFPRPQDIRPYTSKNIVFYYTPLENEVLKEKINKMHTFLNIVKRKKIKYAFTFLPLTLNWIYDLLPNFCKRYFENRFTTSNRKICTSFVKQILLEMGLLNSFYLQRPDDVIPTPQELMIMLEKHNITKGVFKLK